MEQQTGSSKSPQEWIEIMRKMVDPKYKAEDVLISGVYSANEIATFYLTSEDGHICVHTMHDLEGGPDIHALDIRRKVESIFFPDESQSDNGQDKINFVLESRSELGFNEYFITQPVTHPPISREISR